MVSFDKDLKLNWFGLLISQKGIAVMIEYGFKSRLILIEAMIDPNH